MQETKQRIALVTGASRGIGKGIALALAEAGFRVACAARSSQAIAELAQSIDGLAVSMDVSDPTSIMSGVDDIEQTLGPVDVLVSNAGVAMSAPLDRTSDDDWAKTIAVNLSAGFLLSRRLVPGMVERGQGRVIYLASNAGLAGYSYTSAYCASKHGIIGLMRALAHEYARSGVTFNAVCPGFVETDIVRETMETIQKKTGRDSASARKALEAMNPQRRLIQVDEVVHSVLALVDDGARGINGQAITIDGGQVMH